MSDTLSPLERLRAGTCRGHASIETVPALSRLLAADLTQPEYVTTLQHMHAFHATFEPIVAAALAGHPQAAGMLDGARPQALAEDLAWFGKTSARRLPRRIVPALDDPSRALGALYVIEGSGLGGRVIARHLSLSLGVAPGRGGSFYGGLSAEAARRRWHCLCALLDTPGLAGTSDATDGVVSDPLVDGAVATFGLLERWMRRIDVEPGYDLSRIASQSRVVAVAA